MVNTVSDDPRVKLHLDKVIAIKQTNLILQDARIGLGVQVVVDEHFQGRGLRRAMLIRLLNQMKGQLDFFFSTITKENKKALHVHPKDGWQIIDEDEYYSYVILPVTK